MMRKFHIEVVQTIEIELDESKFDEAFMQEFRESFYQFDTIEEHAEHIAQLQARGVYELQYSVPDEFVEGYGPASEMGIKAKIISMQTEMVTP